MLNKYDLEVKELAKQTRIPFSFWGTPEAGRKYNQLYVLFDTPVHSIFHETCHFVCMPKKCRSSDTINAGGYSLEENATCYLQILMSDCIEGFNRSLHMKNMDE